MEKVLTWLNVLGEDPDEPVSVRAGLFMVEAQSVKNFVLHRAGVQATLSLQRDPLSSPLATDVGPAPETHIGQKKLKELVLCAAPQRLLCLLLVCSTWAET